MNTRRQSVPRVCAVISCQRRLDLATVRSFVPGLLVDVDLCREHRAEHEAAVHQKFRESFGVDFVDPTRN